MTRVVGEREERLREALEELERQCDYGDKAYADLLWIAEQGQDGMEPEMERLVTYAYEATNRLSADGTERTILERAREALASSPSPPDRLDGAECHELYSMWLAHNAGEGVDPGHPLVTAGEKLARRMDPGHPRFQAREDEE